MTGWKRWAGDQHLPPPAQPSKLPGSCCRWAPSLPPAPAGIPQPAVPGCLAWWYSPRGPGERCACTKGRGVTSPYLNMRPHHGGVGVVGGRLGAGGALGGQNQVGWEEEVTQSSTVSCGSAEPGRAGVGRPWRQEKGPASPLCGIWQGRGRVWTLKVGLWAGPLAQRAKLCGLRHPDRRAVLAQTPALLGMAPRPLHPSLWPYQGRHSVHPPRHCPPRQTGGPSPGCTWKKPGAMGPDAIASLGAMLPITGLGAAAALCRSGRDGKTQVRSPSEPVFSLLPKQPAPQNEEPKPSNYSSMEGLGRGANTEQSPCPPQA